MASAAGVALVSAGSLVLAAVSTPAMGQVTRDRISHPAIGEEAAREVGEAMFETAIVTTMPGATITPDVEMSLGLGGKAVYRTSELFAKPRGKKTTYCGPADIISVTGQSFPMPQFCETEEWLAKRGLVLTPRRVTRVSADNFRQELLYQGKAGTTLKLSYREFSGDLARPAFTQELTFDLADGPVIGTKGARVEVIDASNTTIKYRLLQPFAAGPGKP